MRKSKYGRWVLAIVVVLVTVSAVTAVLGSPLWGIPAVAAFLAFCLLFGNRVY